MAAAVIAHPYSRSMRVTSIMALNYGLVMECFHVILKRQNHKERSENGLAIFRTLTARITCLNGRLFQVHWIKI